MGDFIQELLPNQRGTEVCDGKGNVLGYEDVYEVSDEELEREQTERDIGELFSQADEDIKPPQIGRFLKAIARRGR